MLETFFPATNEKLKPYFLYRTTKYISIEVPIVGIVHKLSQIGALIYVIFSMVSGGSWAKLTLPIGSVNPWAEPMNYSYIARTTADYTDFVYCSNPAFAYDYGNSWVYGTDSNPPMCNSPNSYTITQKTVDSVFFTTAYIENNEHGFPCSSYADSAARLTYCESQLGAGSTLEEYTNGQCVCTGPEETYYPLAVEEMAVAFDHFFYANVKLANGKSLEGQSNNADASPTLDTTYLAADGSETKFIAGPPITIPLQDLLYKSHHAYCDKGTRADMRDGVEDGECKTGITLDEANVDQGKADATNSSKYPAFRTTGVAVTVQIEYTNMENGQAKLNNQNVKATITSTVQSGSWASVGGSTTYINYPSGAVGAETWTLSSQYKQGILVTMTATGKMYTFDIFYVIDVIVSGIVLLGFANTVADFFAFYGLGNGQSTVLRNKRSEKVSKKSEFAEAGLKAAMAAQAFNYFDPDKNGTIEAEDLVRGLAGIEKADGYGALLTPEQAHAIATAIMSDADVEPKSFGSLDFAEFMTCIDGDAASFNFFLENMQLRTELEDFGDCKKAFEAERERVEEAKAARVAESTTSRTPYASRYPDATAVLQTQAAQFKGYGGGGAAKRTMMSTTPATLGVELRKASTSGRRDHDSKTETSTTAPDV